MQILYSTSKFPFTLFFNFDLILANKFFLYYFFDSEGEIEHKKRTKLIYCDIFPIISNNGTNKINYNEHFIATFFRVYNFCVF